MAGRMRVAPLLIAGGLVLAASPAFAQEGMLFYNLMKGVFGKGEAGDIDYRNRAPLVVPPNSTLPPPQQAASERNAAWPNDPDVQRRRDEANPAPFTTVLGLQSNPRMSPQEIRRGRTTRQPTGSASTLGDSAYDTAIQPIRVGRELAARQNQIDQDALAYGAEPPRRTLAEPPAGYRRPASTAPLGPGQAGPVEDKQAVGAREFSTGRGPVMR
ncbi:hypothetical protein [Bosea sp. (in: a-proteobacteria)]|uniref:hypothetical protein n=1 Tax=Bosea sp. (in: a-proteobacteria) TaxID=1871050 RepID=UPI002623E7EB|nr:hypothetical protein [Bosea sp. (in: a-proteobacteria)]MCO5092296.1 hypothetical protein [Bosea sp. (in: a-proteobacteria)]